MAFPFFSSSSEMLGIDIGTHSIKASALVNDKQRFLLKNYAIMEIPPSAGSGKNVFSDDITIAALKELVRLAKFGVKECVTAIPAFHTFSTVLTLPYLSEKDLAQAIPLEAKKYIPLPLKNVILDWTIIDTATETAQSSPKDSNHVGASRLYPRVEIFLAVAPREIVEKFQLIFSRAGLKLRGLELENTALIRSLIGNDKSPAAIVNIGGRSTVALLVDKGFARLSHTYDVGGFEMTRSIAKHLQLSEARAERLKRQSGLTGSEGNMIRQALASLLDMLVFETERAIQNYETKAQRKIDKIILAGGLSAMPGLAEYFSEKSNRTVVKGNPMSRIQYPAAIQKIIPQIAPVLAVSLGLAMREF